MRFVLALVHTKIACLSKIDFFSDKLKEAKLCLFGNDITNDGGKRK
jgi:hypothetical protein